jgi:hypothetical protein
MENIMKANGLMTNKMEKVYLNMLMVIIMKVNIKIIKKMGKEFNYMLMETTMKEVSKKI